MFESRPRVRWAVGPACAVAVLTWPLVALSAASVFSQKTPAGVVVRGVIVDGVTRKPVSGAIVVVADGASGRRPGVETDELGRFVATGLRPGPLGMVASKSGYAGGRLGQVEVADDAALGLELHNAEVRLPGE